MTVTRDDAIIRRDIVSLANNDVMASRDAPVVIVNIFRTTAKNDITSAIAYRGGGGCDIAVVRPQSIIHK